MSRLNFLLEFVQKFGCFAILFEACKLLSKSNDLGLHFMQLLLPLRSLGFVFRP
jgi:hypothetical protein